MTNISVIIPLYNKERSIYKTLQSVCEQSYTDIEILVVDDGSTDNSANIATSYPDSRIRVIHKANGGASSARNAGIRESKSEYVAFMDADDLWNKEYLAEQVKLMHDFPEAAMWGINYAEMYNGKMVRRVPTGLVDGYRGYVKDYFRMKGRVSDLFCSSSVVIRHEVFDKVGMFDERIKYAEDSDMWFRIIATHRVAFYDRYMVFYQWDAENRAMQKQRELRYYLPYYVSKYHKPIYMENHVFYSWINHWSANKIRKYYFEGDETDKQEAIEAMNSLDYAAIPAKYRLLFRLPYHIASILNKLDKLYHK